MPIIPVKSPTDWHNIRARHVGGSEVAALFNKSPYTTRFTLWHTKQGDIPPENLDDNERVQAGTFLEPSIAAWAAKKWDMPLERFEGYAQHETVKGMGCTPDYVTPDGKTLAQIKNVDSLAFSRSDDWSATGDELTSAPLHILLQCQHELACTGADVNWLIVCVGGNRLYRMAIRQRPKTIAKLEAEVAVFWASIRANEAPPADFSLDAETINILWGDAAKNRTIRLDGNNRAHELCAEYEAADALAKDAQARKDAAKAELLTLIGTAEIAFIGDYKINARRIQESKGKRSEERRVGKECPM
jgi:putative phage-type endonuclease